MRVLALTLSTLLAAGVGAVNLPGHRHHAAAAAAHAARDNGPTNDSSTSSLTIPNPLCKNDYWLGKIAHQGLAPFVGAGYKVFRNVRDYGAYGDGSHDDTKAINDAISDGNRCAPAPNGCTGSTKTPALIYFPAGTYLVKGSIIDYYYTQLIGDPTPGCMPILKAAEGYRERFLIDGDLYVDRSTPEKPNNFVLAWGATNVFWRQIANFEIDISAAPSDALVAGIHWPTGQATSLSNIIFRMAPRTNTMQQGLFIEEGSGGYMGDLTFIGGDQALVVGNQQFTMRNLIISGANIAVKQLWSWGWTYVGVSITDCGIGFDFTSAAVGSITIVDSVIKNTEVGITFNDTSPPPPLNNNFAFENIDFVNVDKAITGEKGGVVVAGGTFNLPAWGRGHKDTGKSGPQTFQGPFTPNARPSSLVSGTKYYTRSKPQYEGVPLSSFVSARDAGAKGNGVTDDTAALNKLFASAAAKNKIVFLDAGIYRVTETIKIPAGSRIIGEAAYPVILSSGAFFTNAFKPKPVIQIGKPGAKGSIEWSNTIVSTQGAQAGAILIEFNLEVHRNDAPSGLWDVHTRIGGFAGSNLQLSDCPKTPNTEITVLNLNQQCIAAFMSIHVTKHAKGLYMENTWFWVADHDIEDGANNQQITVYAGRGLLIESSKGQIWLYGTSVEHHQMYEYQLVDTEEIFMGQIQTETAYYQNNPGAQLPFTQNKKYYDPSFGPGDFGWALRVVDSKKVFIYGAGLYSFFDNYNVHCSDEGTTTRCQKRIFSLEKSSISVYNLNTVGTTYMITIDGVDTARFTENLDGFIASVALFRNP
ncbi:glycoside hydrolase family 55 protein [Podospora didyma]|uniref:Glycoside hydrolase family 55 protein n=1 Tax=Podospora didyma TaxID=330526 RepID=A0AAE0NGI4_9PEZI|nr:glycoside hydrolase family 55 protein [Podospora didyma]